MEGLAKTKEELIEKLKSSITLENVNLQPLYSDVWKRVHPAIDVVDGVAYVGVVIPCQVTDKEGKTSIRDFHFLITSDKRQILCHREVLGKERMELAHSVVKLPNRWSLTSVKEWLDGKASVEPQEVYTAVKTAFETYLEFEDERVYDFLTLWSVGTYFFHLFNSYPYLNIHGIKQTGKTKLGSLLSLLCFNAIFSNNLSTSSAFRLVQSGRCTLILDETEKLRNPEREIDFRNMLYAGYKKGAVVYRTHKDTLKPEPFEVYSPKVVIGIKGVEDVLEDRCITLIMTRGRNPKIVNAEIPFEAKVWQDIRDKLYIFYLTRFIEVAELIDLPHLLEETVLDRIKQRELELWKPILAIASYFDRYFNGLFKRITEFAIQKAREKEVENQTETLDFIFARTLKTIVLKDGYYKVKELKEAMAENFTEPQKWLTEKWIGNALRRLGFTDKRRMKSYEYFLTIERVNDLAERLGISESVSNSKCEHPQSSVGSSIPEVYDALRRQLTEPFYDHRAIELIRQLRQCSYEEAEKVFEVWQNEGKVFQNSYGLWEWVK